MTTANGPSDAAGQPSALSGGRDLAVEGLRGIAALMVLYCHLLAPAYAVDPNYKPSDIFWKIETGHAAVLFFFVLSGYVIGLTNPPAASNRSLGGYFRRRVIRIYPLYFLAVLVSLGVRPHEQTGAIIGNFLLLQNSESYGGIHIPLLIGNTNLWSLNYECLYYLLFPLVWLAPRIMYPCLWLSLAVVAFGYFRPFPVLITEYCAGCFFWLTGLLLAWKAPAGDMHSESQPWLSYLLLFIGTAKLCPVANVFWRLGFGGPALAWISLDRVDLVPICIVCLAAASGRKSRWISPVSIVAFVVPGVVAIWKILNGQFVNTEWLQVPSILCLAAPALLWVKIRSSILVRLAPIGAISYGIYIFQRPAQWLVLDYFPLPQGAWWTFTLRVLLACFVTLLLAQLGEHWLQPKAKRLLTAPWQQK